MHTDAGADADADADDQGNGNLQGRDGRYCWCFLQLSQA